MSKLTEEEVKKLIPAEYEFLQHLGDGGFGQVVQCLKKDTKEKVAIKLAYRNQNNDTEVWILTQLMEKGMDQKNIVKMVDWFQTECGNGIVFECLETDFHGHCENMEKVPLSDMRAVVDQMATALDAMKTLGFLHADVKPNNIMLNTSDGKIQAKLIDFGLSMPQDYVKAGFGVSHLCFRAPEVILGLHFTAAVDVWSLGISVVNMLLGFPLIPDHDNKWEAIRIIVKLLGQPPDHLLNISDRTKHFFYEEENSWKILAKEDLEHIFGSKDVKLDYYTELFNSLDELIEAEYKVSSEDEAKELAAFIDLMNQMLQVDPAKRITAEEIHNHPFITTTYCEENGTTTEEQNETTNEVKADSPLISIPKIEINEVGEAEPETIPPPQEDQEVSVVSEMETPLTFEEFKELLPVEFKCLRLLGEGSHGQVFRCRRQETREIVSVRIPPIRQKVKKEARLLQKMMAKGLDKYQIVQYYETIDIGEGTGLVCEKLKMSLTEYQYQQIYENQQMSINDIRSVIQQAAVALSALKCVKLIHTDVRTDSFWLVNNRRDHIDLRLVDFGSVIPKKRAEQGMVVQKICNRAPEVILGLPFTEAIDVWSLGTMAASMLLGFNIFSDRSEYETLKIVVNLLGQPSDKVLKEASKANHFFMNVGNRWRLMTETEFEQGFGMAAGDRLKHESEKFSSFQELIEAHFPVDDIYEKRQLLQCINLLFMMLEVNSAERITPEDILNHPFICQTEPEGCSLEETTMREEVEREPEVIQVQPATPENTTVYLEEEQQCDSVASGDQKTPVKMGNESTSKSPAPMPRFILVKSALPENTTSYFEDDIPCNSEDSTQQAAPEKTIEKTTKAKKKPTPEMAPETPPLPAVTMETRTLARSKSNQRVIWLKPKTMKNPIQYEMNRKVRFASPLTAVRVIDETATNSFDILSEENVSENQFSSPVPKFWMSPKTPQNPVHDSPIESDDITIEEIIISENSTVPLTPHLTPPVSMCTPRVAWTEPATDIGEVQQSVCTGTEKITDDNHIYQHTPGITAENKKKKKKNPLQRMWSWIKKRLS